MNLAKMLMALSLGVVAVPTWAQVEQTPSNAHAFLAKVFEAQDVRYASPGNQKWSQAFRNRNGEWSTMEVKDVPPQKIGLAYSQGCVTQFLDKSDPKLNVDRDENGREIDNTWLRKYRERASTPIDWSKATHVQPVGHIVVVGVAGIAGEYSFASDEMATRVAYAMRVIKDSCDATEGLGF